MDIKNFLEEAVNEGASDVFIVAGAQLAYKLNGQIRKCNDGILKPNDTKELISEIYAMADLEREMIRFGEDDFSFSIPNLARFRVNVFVQRGSLAAVLRIIRYNLPSYKDLLIPDKIIDLANLNSGLVLVTGAAGSGKSTTLACIIDEINKNYSKHIITIEDPIEYLHKHQKSIVSQREVTYDTKNYANALVASLREAPDVILVGEMRDLETIQTALSAAETGHLVFSTLHTMGVSETINRIIDAFPTSGQHQIRVQLSSTLRAIASQKLVAGTDDKLIPVFEMLTINNAIKTQIREGKIHQIDNYIGGIGDNSGSTSIVMDDEILKFYKDGKISKETAIMNAKNREIMRKKIG